MVMLFMLATLMLRIGPKQVNHIEAGHVFIKEVKKAMVQCKPSESEVDKSCTHTSINVEQYIDEVYTLECTLRIWGNKFPILRDLSTWEVPLSTFEFVPNKRLRKKPKGYL
ncbi:hypothetical protein J1N35_037657 [Gossypium stocksii]|uniref:Uncharacterized protein n=1 Tax=Gossypium stocksii TaxID=47602 RepID=A0A9D3UKI8_9ROSI|nr:hypothetical protein J1N35_037657 [Gossypium stocksii]